MKMKVLILVVGLLLIGGNLYAANGDLIVNGNLGIGATTPQSRLDVEDYQFVKLGQAGIFLKSTAYATAKLNSSNCYDDSSYSIAEAKNVNGILYVRASVKFSAYSCDTGWVAGNTAYCTITNSGGLPWTYHFHVKATSAGVTVSHTDKTDTSVTCSNTVDW